MTTVLDTSAMLAWIRNEPGADKVDSLIPSGVMSTVNWSELMQKLLQHGSNAEYTTTRLLTLGVRVELFTLDDSRQTAELWSHTRIAGLSFGDRACLALARRLDAEVATADQAWADIEVGVTIRLIR